MAKDVEIIKRVEKIIGKELGQITLDEISGVNNNGYAVDVNERVIGLNLDETGLSDIFFLETLKNLSHLSLYENQITDITPLKDLKNLETLDVSNNKISQLPADIGDWESPMEIKWEKYGEGIFLEGNPLEIPPVEIVIQGRKAVAAYFKALGDGGAGKTSLVKRLMEALAGKSKKRKH